MANTTRLKFSLAGLDSFKRVLDELGGNIATRISNIAVKETAEVIKVAAQANLTMNDSIESGLLRESIGVRFKRYSSSKTSVAIIGPRGDFVGQWMGRKRWPLKYAHLVEYGTLPHKITMRIPTADGKFTTRTIIHTGARPKPFMRPAMDENKNHAIVVLRRLCAERLDREARRLAAKQFREAAREATMISIPQPVRIARTGAVGYRVAGGGAALGVASMSTFDREFRREAALAARAAGGRLPRRR